MENKNLIEVKEGGFFSKIKNWFKNLFGKNTQNVSNSEELEFEKQQITPEYDENQNTEEKIKYEFSNQTVSKQKIEKIKKELDIGNIGFEELYQLSKEEIDELGKLYDNQIEDTVLKLNEVQVSLDGYIRKLAKIQAQNQ